MNQPLVTKQIARSIQLIRYLPEHQLYQLSVQWQPHSNSLVYLPEIFIYPYAIQKQIQLTQSTKVSDSSFNELPDHNLTTLHPEQNEAPSILTSPIGPSPPKPAKQILDYDKVVTSQEMEEWRVARNREVMVIRVKESRKRKRT